MSFETLYWLAYILVKRWCCAVLDHQDGVRIRHGYAITRCARCWRTEVDPLPEVPA